eukprot:gene5423-5656_t
MDSEQQEQVKLTDIFSLNKPRDIKAGIASGLKSLGKGVVGGTVGLIAAPILGAATGGVAGFAKGIATGVAGAVLLPATGVSVAVVQVTRGFINQSEAVMESYKGRVWDQSLRCWVEQPGVTALTSWESQAGGGWRQHLGLPGSDRQQDYYHLLQVPRDASPAEIKRQFYSLARRHHPDKNPGDADAHMRFQQLSQSYQVLINPHLRAQYDQHGDEGLQVDFVDGAAFYTALFGSELFEHLVGELAIAMLARSLDSPTAAELQQAQQARVAHLAERLTALLSTFVEGDEAGFKVAMRRESERLAATSFGVPLLHCIGGVYCLQADMVLGGWWGGTWAGMKHSHNLVRANLNVAGAALKDLLAKSELEEMSMELCLEAMWAANVADIQNTLSAVCSAVLQDGSVSRQLRHQRALALRELGAIFAGAASTISSSASEQTAKQRIQAVHEALLEKQMAEQDKQWTEDAQNLD